jgi:4-oxalocrotonate tautomerase
MAARLEGDFCQAKAGTGASCEADGLINLIKNRRTRMPFVQIQMLEGRDDEKKRQLIVAVTNAICETLAAPPESVRVVLTDVPKTHWGVGGKTMKELGR